MILDRLGSTCVIGLFWGDEGKGKIVDVLTERADIAVRYNGGANAGHTVVVGQEKFALHLVPAGALHAGKTGVIGPGVALDLAALVDEMRALAARGIDVQSRLKISPRCHLVMPYHQLEDRLSEAALSAEDRIGTTARGIGPCYADKMRRSSAFRFCDLNRPQAFRDRLRRVVDIKQRIFDAIHGGVERLDAGRIADTWLQLAERLAPLACDTTSYLQEALRRGQRLVFEGAHGTLLDIDHGTYPYVTSSSASALGVASGAGVPPAAVQDYIGVVKAYSTRVGHGPFPTELTGELGERIRTRGREYGTTTGRPRRCGWFDAVAAGYGVRLGGIQHIALMHLDTLSGFDTIRICMAYRHGGRLLETFPAESEILNEVEPVYDTVPGWSEDLSAARRFDELPPAAVRYVEKLERAAGARVAIISVGPDRHQTIFRD